MKIGDLRRKLFTHYDSKWNGWVRDTTAAIEKEDEEVSEVEMCGRVVALAKLLMLENDILKGQMEAAKEFYL